MGQALYRKYRPKRLSEVVGQEPITDSLERALKAGHLSHAYLFTGPRGVGKTSVARILAHEVNDLPYDDDSPHLDIIEIDAASNRRIDEIRDLRDRVNVAPTSATYKVYIIDEVHMLTREAFNALLKTLEEPPAHVIFILATTEAHKLPATIVSRTQRFAFRPIGLAIGVAHLRTTAATEKIAIDDEALELIAKHGQGSFRDSLSLLDQARATGTQIGVNEIRSLLGLAPDESITALIEQTEMGDTVALISSLTEMQAQGFEAAQLAKQLSANWRARLLAGQSRLNGAQVLRALEQLIGVSNSSEPLALLEIILLGVALTIKPQTAPAKATASKPVPASLEPAIEATPEPPKAKPAKAPDANWGSELWPVLLDTIKRDHNTLYGIMRMAEPEFSDSTLVLGFHFAFHQKRLNEARNKKIIADTIQQLTGRSITILCELRQAASNSQSLTPEQASEDGDPSLETISNIFGSAELLESEN